MARKIALFGGAGVGKSTLAAAIAGFCQKRGQAAGVANFDAGCRHILYKPVFDVRGYYSLRKIISQGNGLREEEGMAEVYRRACADSLFNADFRAACASKQFVLLDFAGPLDYFLLRGGSKALSHFADKAVFVTDYNALSFDSQGLLTSALNSLLESALRMPVFTFINKCEVLEKKRKRLLQKSLLSQSGEIAVSPAFSENFVGGRVVRGSALEGMGVRELFALLAL